MDRGEFDERSGEFSYVSHPAIIDAMLQTSFLASTGGTFAKVRPWIPVTIDEIQINRQENANPSDLGVATIKAQTYRMGFGTIVADSELHCPAETVIIRIKGGRATEYQGIGNSISHQERVPILRVCWKPDILYLTQAHGKILGDYIALFARATAGKETVDDMAVYLAGCIDLAAHKNPRNRVLSIADSEDAVQDCQRLLKSGGSYRCFESWSIGNFDDEQRLQGRDLPLEANPEAGFTDRLASERHLLDLVDFDLIVCHYELSPTQLEYILERDTGQSRIIVSLPSKTPLKLTESSRPVVIGKIINSGCSLAVIQPQSITSTSVKKIYLIGNDGDSELNVIIMKLVMAMEDVAIEFVAFDQIMRFRFSANARAILAVEFDGNILQNPTASELEQMKRITSRAAHLMCITRGDIVRSRRPEATLILGAARAIMMEQPSLRMSIFDTDDESSIAETAANIVRTFMRQSVEDITDLEFAQRHDIIHVSRWVPDDLLNSDFAQKISQIPSDIALNNAGPIALNVRKAGQLETLSFDRESQKTLLGAAEVEVDACCYGMNAKDLYLIHAKFDSEELSCSCEFAGIVRRVGICVQKLSVGDRVVVMAPGRYRNSDIVPEWACAKLLPSESFEDACTMPVVFCSALYALKYRAGLKAGESVLIQCGSGGLGLAAIQVARFIGAEIYTTAGSSQKRNFIQENCGIPQNHIYSSRDSQFLASILDATHGVGVDVVLNCLTGDLLQDSFKACAEFGRFVDVGKKDILDNSRLEMASFANNLTFTAFDLMNIYRLIHETLDMWREGNIAPVRPCKVFDISDITNAFRYFSQASRMGKVVVSLKDPLSKIKVAPAKYETLFDETKSYIMIGCFGGVGRSITKWMLSRGARRFVFLSRTGATRPAAKQLIKSLDLAGAETRVVTGDIAVAAHCQNAIDSAETTIGGVVQASMAVKAIHWESMIRDDWIQSINSKVQGSWNLHHCLARERGASLDFLLFVSSVSGTIGSATEPGYCAANAFMDNFARFRRAQGLPATSLALGVINEVGYLHEHPEMEAVFTRRGLQGINEEEMLQLVDLALSRPMTDTSSTYDPLMNSQLLTGLELQLAKAQVRQQGSSVLTYLLKDPRAGFLEASFWRDVGNEAGSGQGYVSSAVGQVPSALNQRMAEGAPLDQAARDILAARFCKIIMLPEAQLKDESPLSSFGFDSMLAAEFRAFVFDALRVDVSFMVLLSGDSSITSLTKLVVKELKAKLDL